MKLLVFDPTKVNETNFRKAIFSSPINSKTFFQHWEDECERNAARCSVRVMGSDISASWLDDQPLILIPFLRFASFDFRTFREWLDRNPNVRGGEFFDSTSLSRTEIFFFRQGRDFETVLQKHKTFVQNFLWNKDLASITETLRAETKKMQYPVPTAFDWRQANQKIEFESWANWFGCHVAQRLSPPARVEYDGDFALQFPRKNEKEPAVLLAPENIYFDFLRSGLNDKVTNPEIDFVLFTEDRNCPPQNPSWIVLTEKERVRGTRLDMGMLDAARFSGQIWFRRYQLLETALTVFQAQKRPRTITELVNSLVEQHWQGIIFPYDHRVSLKTKADRVTYERWKNFFTRYPQFHDPLASRPDLR